MPSSPTLTAAKIVSDIRPRIDNQEIDVRQIGSHLLYGMQSSGHSYGFGMNLHPFDLPLLKYGSEPPSYSSPSGNQATSLSFAMQYLQATGTAAMTSHYMKFLGAKMNTLEISVSSQGLVEANTDWICREIAVPTATAISGATWPEFADITTAALSNVDGGNKPLKINSVDYAVKDFRIQWNNNLIPDQFSGSGLIDALTTGPIDISGSFNTPIGQSLLLETAIHDFPQTGVAAVYKVKTGVMFINMTGFKLMSDAPEGFTAGPTNTGQRVFNFKCTAAALATS